MSFFLGSDSYTIKPESLSLTLLNLNLNLNLVLLAFDLYFSVGVNNRLNINLSLRFSR
jgi:hypothetical protein